MSDLPTPRASRLPRSRWLDPRLVLGLVLVLVSVVLGAKLLSEADDRVHVWSVTRDLGADSVLDQRDLAVTSVRLDDAAAHYLAASEDLEGMVLARPVGAGELLPVDAVRPPSSSDHRRLVIEVERAGVAGLEKGDTVDLYAASEAEAGELPPRPQLLLSNVTVAEDVRTTGEGFGVGGSQAGVALLVPRGDVPQVLGAVAQGSVYVVGVPTGAAASSAGS